MTAVSIIGGGRWARTIAGEIASLPAAPDLVVLHSRHGAAYAKDWITEHRLQARVRFTSDWPNFGTNKPDAVIVANRTADHAASAAAALDAGVPVLIEKPMAIGADEVRQLRARAGNTILAASHVFLFARYIDAFADQVSRSGPVERLDVLWQDGQADVVRGEVKSYDSAVTIFDDVLPHVLPILARLHPVGLSLGSLALAGGGSQVTIEAEAGGVPVSIRLARNGPKRRRVLSAQTEGGVCAIDFSTEPGVLDAPCIGKRDADPLWDTAPRPLRSMLMAFLAILQGAALDSRLSPEKALAAAVFADTVREPYRRQQREWLEKGDAYALREISGEV